MPVKIDIKSGFILLCLLYSQRALVKVNYLTNKLPRPAGTRSGGGIFFKRFKTSAFTCSHAACGLPNFGMKN